MTDGVAGPSKHRKIDRRTCGFRLCLILPAMHDFELPVHFLRSSAKDPPTGQTSSCPMLKKQRTCLVCAGVT